MNKSKKDSFQLSGQKAKDWRLTRAMQAERIDDVVETIKYDLDVSKANLPDMPVIEQAYRTTSLASKGSLIWLLAVVHSVGLRVFSSKQEAQIFAAKPFLDENWGAHLQSKTPGFEVESSEIIQWFTSNKTIDYSIEAIARRLYFDFTKTSYNPENANDTIYQIAHTVASDLTDTFDSWKSMTQNPEDALALADRHLRIDNNMVSLIDQYHAIPEQSFLCPMALDVNSPWFVPDPTKYESVWQKVVALKLHQIRTSSPDLTFAKMKTALKTEVLSPNANALNWLFGAGLKTLKSLSKEEIASNLFPAVDDGLQRAEQLYSAVQSIQPNDLFGGNYGKFRSRISGSIGSWLSNYANRLQDFLNLIETSDLHLDIPKSLANDEYASLFFGTNYNFDSLASLYESVKGSFDSLQSVVNSLIGVEPSLTDDAIFEFEHLRSQLDDFIAVTSQINNNISQALKRKGGKAKEKELKSLIINLPPSFKPVPKLNTLAPILWSATDYAEELTNTLNNALKKYTDHVSYFVTTLEKLKLDTDPLETLTAKAVSKWKSNERYSVQEVKVRFLVSRLTSLAHRLSVDGAKLLVDQLFDTGAVVSKREASRAAIGKTLIYYKSPYSQVKSKVGRVNPEWKLHTYQTILTDLEILLSARCEAGMDVHYRDLILVRDQLLQFEIQKTPKELPSKVLKVDTYLPHIGISNRLQLALNQKTVAAGDVFSVMSLHSTAVNSALSQVSQSHIVRKMNFMQEGACSVYFCPKENATFNTQNAWEQGVYSEIDKSNPDGGTLSGMDAGKALKTFLSNNKITAAQLDPKNVFLKEFPNDWCINLGLAESGELRHGLEVKKGKIKMAKLTNPSRIQADRRRKEFLVNLLKDPSATTGDYSWIIEDNYIQTLQYDDGVFSVTLEQMPTRHFASIPFSYKQKNVNTDATEIRYLAGFDLDQRGIGYAVFDLDTEKYIAEGQVPVKSAKRLLAQVVQHRRTRQPKQNMGSKFSAYQSNLREKVTGDYCHEIDKICAQYDAWPVIENHFKPKSSGSRNLGIVFEEVAKRYIYSSTKADSSTRKQHWRGAQAWLSEHNEVVRDTNKSKALKFYPGRGQSPFRTSQCCSECHRDPLSDLFESIDKKKPVKLNDAGELKLGEGVIEVRSSAPFRAGRKQIEALRKKWRSKNMTTPYDFSLTGTHDFDDVKKTLQFQLRRPDKHIKKNQGFFEFYHCPYTDCGHVELSSTNASKNLIRMFLDSRNIS